VPEEKKEKMVTVYIDGYPRRCTEERLPEAMKALEELKDYYVSKGIPREKVERMHPVRIVRDD
jgi:hypothetical protein